MNNILIVSSLQEETPPKGYGGIERFIHYLAENLCYYKYNVTVLCKKDSLGGNYNILHTNEGNLFNDLMSFIEGFPVDIIHINTRDEKLIRELSDRNIKTIVTLHNNIRKTSGWARILSNLSKNMYLVTVSKNHKSRLEDAFVYQNISIPVNGIQTIEIGMDLGPYMNKINKNLPKEYFIYIGGLFKHKAVLDIIKVFSHIGERLLVVGPTDLHADPEYIKEVVDLISKCPNINLFGETKNEEEKIDLLKKAKGLIIASGYDKEESDFHEPFGLVMLEANALGIPVYGYSQGNIRDYIIENLNGYKFENIDELPKLISNSGDLSKTSLEYSKNFAIEIITRKYIDLFDSITS